MKNIIEIYPNKLIIDKKRQKRSCLIKEKLKNSVVHEKELWYQYPLTLPMPKDENCDSYLLATLLPAMKIKADIHVYGSVSKDLLANLTELQYIWNKWCPERFSLINITVDEIRYYDNNLSDAVVAFSGGADAQFSIYRHAKKLVGYANQNVVAGIFIHGFDIPLIDKKGFDSAKKLASSTLKDINIKLYTVETNVRTLWNINWEYYHATALISVLSGFERIAGTGLIASGGSYDNLSIPWGSHPMSDPLLSSKSFKVIHDGAGFNRSEKIKVLSNWKVGLENLRVCWEGEYNDRNCGKCEKCIRTYFNLILAGVDNPPCFEKPIESSDFNHIILNSPAKRKHWEVIYNEIVKTHKGIEWLPHIKKVIKRNPKPKFQFLLPVGSNRRNNVKKLMLRLQK